MKGQKRIEKYKVTTEKYLEYYQTLGRILELLNESHSVWDEKKRSNTINKHLETHIKIFLKTIHYLHTKRCYIKPDLDIKLFKKCFAKPNEYLGNVNFAKNKREALKLFEKL